MSIEQLHSVIGGQIITADGKQAISIRYGLFTGPVYERITTSGHTMQFVRENGSINVIVY